GVDAGLVHHLGGPGRRPAGAGRGAGGALRPDLAVEALEGPVAAPLDLRGDGRQGDDRAELGPAALELERGDVVLEAGVIDGKRLGRGPSVQDGGGDGKGRPGADGLGLVGAGKAEGDTSRAPSGRSGSSVSS